MGKFFIQRNERGHLMAEGWNFRIDWDVIDLRRIPLKNLSFSPLAVLLLVTTVAAGLIFLVAGIKVFARNQAIVAHGIKVDGQVSDLVAFQPETRAVDSPSRSWAPEFSYRWEGREYSNLSRTRTSSIHYLIGEKVQLFINPGNPLEMLVDDFRHRWLLPIVFWTVGGAVLIAGEVIWHIHRPREMRS